VWVRGIPFDNFSGGNGRPYPNEQVNVIRLNSKLKDLPLITVTLGLNKHFTVFSNFAHKNRLSAFWTSNQVINDKVNAMLIALIFHVDIICSIDNIRTYFGLKPERIPPSQQTSCAGTHILLQLKPGGLRRALTVRSAFA
jgi:hypothetical protein